MNVNYICDIFGRIDECKKKQKSVEAYLLNCYILI